jgi:hypothetical protein
MMMKNIFLKYKLVSDGKYRKHFGEGEATVLSSKSITETLISPDGLVFFIYIKLKKIIEDYYDWLK